MTNYSEDLETYLVERVANEVHVEMWQTLGFSSQAELDEWETAGGHVGVDAINANLRDNHYREDEEARAADAYLEKNWRILDDEEIADLERTANGAR